MNVEIVTETGEKIKEDARRIYINMNTKEYEIRIDKDSLTVFRLDGGEPLLILPLASNCIKI